MISKQVMYLKVYTYEGRKFLEGYSLEAMNRYDLVCGEEDQIYEFYDDEIDQIVIQFNNDSNEFEIIQEERPTNKSILEHLYMKPLSEMSYEELLRYYKKVMHCDETEAIAMASMWDEINKSAQADAGQSSK